MSKFIANCVVMGVGLSIQTDPRISESMLAAGAAGFLPKETIGKELYPAIQTAVRHMKSFRSIGSGLSV